MEKFIETPVKKLDKKTVKNIQKKTVKNELDRVSTLTMILFLIRKHKYFLVCVYAIVISLFYFIPTTPEFIRSLFQ